MINSAKLLTALKGQVKVLEADLRARAEDETTVWGATLRTEFSRATARERTGLSWIDWRDGQVAQAAVAWIIASVFIRFSEDNGLLDGLVVDGTRAALPWFAGPSEGTERAVENQSAFYTANPTAAGPDWLRHAFRALAALPAGRALVDPDHSMVWSAPISGEAADGLLQFWRASDANGQIVHDFTDASLDTRFLGDLYQDLSEFAKKQYALLQTPVFVEEFILDQTLTSAIEEFGLDGLKLIDPTCGSGHFLLGAFARLNAAWASEAPGMDARARVKLALASVHGIDLNPFAVAIARFRLTVAALQAAGDRTLVGAPDYNLKLAIGDSLLGSQASSVKLDIYDDAESFSYSNEDIAAYYGILQPNQYHVVVGNPPYITVKDPALNQKYRELYRSAFRQYQLSAPFFELFFQLAARENGTKGAGYVGQITSNGFMTQEFGVKLVEEVIAGFDFNNPIELTSVVDSSGAYIPGHGTPTVIVFGRHRRSNTGSVRAVASLRGEPSTPTGTHGHVWEEIIASAELDIFDGQFVAVRMIERTRFNSHPWLIQDPAAAALKADIERSARPLSELGPDLGYTGQTNSDDAFLATRRDFGRRGVELDVVRDFVTGVDIRDYQIRPGMAALFPYSKGALRDIAESVGAYRWLWPVREQTWSRATFSKRTYKQEGRAWWEWHQVSHRRVDAVFTITFASVATHAQFALDRERRIFNRHAAFIQLPAGASENQHLELLGVLNSSTACFWLKQVSHNKGDSTDTKGARVTGDPAFDTYEFTGTKLQEFPLPAELPLEFGRLLDSLAHEHSAMSPRVAIKSAKSDSASLSDAVLTAQNEWDRLRARLVFEQEELDWFVYRAYGLVDDDLTYKGGNRALMAGQRAFEIALARRLAEGVEKSTWFSRNGSTPVTDSLDEWSDDYRELVQRRLDVIASNSNIRMLEKPEYKRRWATRSWDDQLADALREAMLEHLEAPTLWGDMNGRPVTRSVNELAELVRTDSWFVELAQLATGSKDVDFRTVVGSLLSDESVPYLAALRHKPSGLEKFRAWERTWELQRAEDRGEQVTVPVPPKYGQADFRKPTYWKARGKLDVPKERFIAYPGTNRPNDASPLYGWAGWNHADRAQALARLPMELIAAGGTAADVTPLVAGLFELQPWLDQWHGDVDPTIGVSPAAAISGLTDQLLTQTQLSRDTVTSWQPPAATRGRAASPKGSK